MAVVKFDYFGDCASLPGHLVQYLGPMKDEAVDVTYRTFRRRVSGLDDWATEHGYELHGARGLTLSRDWHVSYHRSRFNDRPCYFLVWSGFECIWLASRWWFRGAGMWTSEIEYWAEVYRDESVWKALAERR